MDENLQFDKAELNQPAATTCAACQAPLRGQYFQAMGKVLCESCAGQVRQYNAGTGAGPGGSANAVALGVGAAIAGAAAYGALIFYTQSRWGIAAIGIGWLVGRGVRMGSGGRGSLGLQILAVVLTYSSVAGGTAGALLAHVDGVTAAHVTEAIVFGYSQPFLGGLNNVLGIIMIAFGLWEAWRLNQRVQLEVTGPHALGAAPRIAPGA